MTEFFSEVCLGIYREESAAGPGLSRLMALKCEQSLRACKESYGEGHAGLRQLAGYADDLIGASLAS